MAEHLGAVVQAGTSGVAGERVVSAMRCRRRPGRRLCQGYIAVVRLETPAVIEWWCTSCGDDGVISGWEGSPFDLRPPALRLSGDVSSFPGRVDYLTPTTPMGAAPTITGRWRIVEMELWDAETIHLVGPAFIEFGPDTSGSFQFVAVDGWMDVRPTAKEEQGGVEFSWEGDDESDPTSGRGWATLAADGSLVGRIFIHLGDDSAFRAVREPDVKRSPRSPRHQ